MNINERISKIIEYSKLSASEFADEIDVQRSSISHITSGRNKPSLDFIIKIKDQFPEINWDWLIKGKGEMIITKEISSPHKELDNQPKEPPTPSGLFSFLDEEFVEKEKEVTNAENVKASESNKPIQYKDELRIFDSQRLEIKEIKKDSKIIDNQQNKIKRIVLFYENGKFESFEP